MKNGEIDIKTIIKNASEIIAPLWPMQTMIARNPLQGLESLHFEDAITIGQALFAKDTDHSGYVSEVNREMIKWCQVFLDEGQATITMPMREKGFYRAWASLAPFDYKLQSSKKNRWLLSLPSEPEETILFCLKKLNIPDDQVEAYLKHSLAELPGWTGYIKWRSEWRNTEIGSKNPINLTDYLAVRLATACAIQKKTETKEINKDTLDSKTYNKEFFDELKNNENKFLSHLLKMIIPRAKSLEKVNNPISRPEAQIVFCIDVRSEPLRARIEEFGCYETFGFAGFFGLPISIHNYNTDQLVDCCPVLLKPIHKLHEEPAGEQSTRIRLHQKGRYFFNICRRFYQNLKYNFGTSFALVETLGIWCGLWMAIRTMIPQCSVKLRKAIQERIKPTVSTHPKIDIPLANKIAYGETVLKMIGLTKNFGRLVVLCGHGSQTENNPYASALDCGACGGNHGGSNAAILATILNCENVRTALINRGILIPEDTLFVGAEHNTTTDEVVLKDHGILKNTHKEILEKLKADFIEAGLANSQYRCQAFGFKQIRNNAKNHVLKRSSDWSEVRPEWGLARNAAFIIGPRRLTKGTNLDGRCFLHSYEWKEDVQGKLLESILTAPMLVAEWINTQYFFSTLNNVVYGSGSKVTHNITGKFGVMQGNSSDLMQGLPLQSLKISDDQCYHELMRLQVVVYAPRYRIESIIESHTILQTLFFNNWVILTAIDPAYRKPYRLFGKAKWEEISMEEDAKLSFHSNTVSQYRPMNLSQQWDRFIQIYK